jgi:hypothetical protein
MTSFRGQASWAKMTSKGGKIRSITDDSKSIIDDLM